MEVRSNVIDQVQELISNQVDSELDNAVWWHQLRTPLYEQARNQILAEIHNQKREGKKR